MHLLIEQQVAHFHPRLTVCESLFAEVLDFHCMADCRQDNEKNKYFKTLYGDSKSNKQKNKKGQFNGQKVV